LTLYLRPSTLAAAFRSPVFPVVLGRSQDLACITSVEEVSLAPATGAYFENTLLPFSWRTKTGFGSTTLMSRYVTPPPAREPSFERYVSLRRGERIFTGEANIDTPHARRVLRFESDEQEWLVDLATPTDKRVHRGVVFLSFVD
jgi:CRISPR-associated protein Cas5t